MVGDRIREQVKATSDKLAAATSDTKRVLELTAVIALAALGVALIGLGVALLAVRKGARP